MAITVQEKLAASQRKADEIEKIEAAKAIAIQNTLRLRFGIEEVLPEVLEFQKQQVAAINIFFDKHIEARRLTLEAMFV